MSLGPDDQTLVASAVEAAGRAAVWFARAVVVALAGLLAALLAFLALVLQSAGLLLKTVAEFATAALPIALGAVPHLARLLCLAFALGATGCVGVVVFRAFGGDWLAAGLAALLAPTPFMTIYVASPGWPQALAAGALALAGAGVFALATPLVRMGIVFVIFAWLVTRRLQREEKRDGEPGEDVVAEGRLE